YFYYIILILVYNVSNDRGSVHSLGSVQDI
ncbi:unnamed protein product, partial [marine sediment metagenome]